MREGFFFMIQQIVKRDGRMAPFEIEKIAPCIPDGMPITSTFDSPSFSSLSLRKRN